MAGETNTFSVNFAMNECHWHMIYGDKMKALLTPDKIPWKKATEEDERELTMIHIGDYRVARVDGWIYEMGYEYETYDEPNLMICATPTDALHKQWYWDVNERKWKFLE